MLGKYCVDARHGLPNSSPESKRPRRRHHRVALADKELIAHQVPQPVKGGADGGLAQTYAFAGAGDAPLLHQGVEDAQQIEIERGDIHQINRLHTIIRFPT
ncbi:hypothetical protein [Mesorhizobium sp. CAU 1741]|uniref:hypothetical protein n=1 Tax=Mesorhizobium sp. CAU 1741 TaxID=3140366 RepID=UPI00325B3DB8